MNYYQLTDPLRAGQIIREDGRKHFRFVYGSYQWDRTTLFQAYLTEGTPLFGKYQPVTEEQAMKLLTQYGRNLATVLKKADEIAEKAHAGQVCKGGRPYIEHPRTVADNLVDWDEKIVALLHDVCEDTPVTLAELRSKGIPPHLCLAIDLLTKKEGQSYQEYLRALRQNRIARNVKLMDLSHNMDIDRIPNPTDEDRKRVEKYKKARQYLYGDIPEFREELDEKAAEQPQKAWLSSETIYKNIYPLALGGRKVPHGVSNPVLRDRNGQLCMAFFVYTYTRDDLEKGMVRRPGSWMIADPVNGKLLEEISCGTEDFSNASKEERYSTDNPNGPKSREFFSETYRLLDAVRQEYSKTGKLDKETYRQYLETVLQAVPPAYHRFYRELSL